MGPIPLPAYPFLLMGPSGSGSGIPSDALTADDGVTPLLADDSSTFLVQG